MVPILPVQSFCASPKLRSKYGAEHSWELKSNQSCLQRHREWIGNKYTIAITVTITIMAVTCEIDFDNNPHGTYFGGQVVSGRVTLRLDKVKLVKGERELESENLLRNSPT